MKKKHLLIIIGQSVTIVLLVVYSFVQQTAANVSRRDAEAQKNIAEQMRTEAEKQRKFAEVNAMEAAHQAEEARRQQSLCEELRKKGK